MAIRIVTDSCADLSADLACRLGVVVVPCHIRLNGINYLDGVDLTAGEFYPMLEKAEEAPSTSQPSIGELQQVYKDILAQDHQIVSVHLSGRLSGTCNVARQAKATLGHDAPIEIVDSEQVSVAQRLVVAKAAQLSKQDTGHGFKEVASQLRNTVDLTRAYVAVESLLPLSRGGRIGRAKHLLDSPPGHVHVLEIRKGEVYPATVAPNWNKAMEALIELALMCAPLEDLGVGYSTSEADATRLCRSISTLISGRAVAISQFGPTIGVHLGPNALGIGLVIQESLV